MRLSMIQLKQQMQKKILILDGAMGTMIQQADLIAEDFGGDFQEGCNEILNITQPDFIKQIHEQYLQAGVDIIETNTFGATRIVLEEYGIQERAEEINLAAARLAKKAADAYSTADWPRFVAGAMGPTTKTLSVTGGVTFDALAEAYYVQARSLIQGGVDILLIETAQDMLNVKACFMGIRKAFIELKREVPLMVSGTIEPMGTTLACGPAR